MVQNYEHDIISENCAKSSELTMEIDDDENAMDLEELQSEAPSSDEISEAKITIQS